MLKKEYQNLSTEEKLDLVEELWESIRQDANIELSDAHKKMILDRGEELKSGKVKGATWEQVSRGLKSRIKK